MVNFNEKVPLDGEVYALSDRTGYTRAEFVETPGDNGADGRIAWRLYDRLGRGVLLTGEEIENLCYLTRNYYGHNK